jgi:hypothetical protein
MVRARGEDPRSKIQDPEKHQDPISKTSQGYLDFGIWIFSGSWILDLGSFGSNKSQAQFRARLDANEPSLEFQSDLRRGLTHKFLEER